MDPSYSGRASYEPGEEHIQDRLREDSDFGLCLETWGKLDPEPHENSTVRCGGVEPDWHD